MAEMVPLKRCKCGANAILRRVRYDAADFGEDGFYWEALCSGNCGMQSACEGTKMRAIKAWNDSMLTNELPDVLMFIGRFTTDGWGKRRQVEDCFLFGCCWWFAWMLRERFWREYSADIVVDYTQYHFACRINGHVYDVTGLVNGGTWEKWEDCEDEALKKRITDQCIMF